MIFKVAETFLACGQNFSGVLKFVDYCSVSITIILASEAAKGNSPRAMISQKLFTF